MTIDTKEFLAYAEVLGYDRNKLTVDISLAQRIFDVKPYFREYSKISKEEYIIPKIVITIL